MEGTRLAAERGAQQTVVWELNTEGWRGKMWDNITRADVTSAQIANQGWEVKKHLAAESRAERDAEFAAGTAERTQREAMAWKGRPKGISYPLERLHLNRRRARNRAAKEERAAHDAQLRKEAEEVARKVLAGEN